MTRYPSEEFPKDWEILESSPLRAAERAVIEAARYAPHELKSILESLSFAPPESLPLHYARLAELGNELYEVASALEAAEKGE